MKPIGTHNYYVYILTNVNKGVLYTGVTNSLSNRQYKHEFSSSKTSFTQKYNCHYLIYYERFQYIKDAIAREKEIKGWSRKKKDALITSFNPNWNFLDPE